MDLGGLVVEVAGDRDRSILAMRRLLAVFRIGLEAAERGQDLVEAPARVAGRSPGVKVGRRTPHPEAGEPGRAAQQPASPQGLRGAGLVRLRGKLPVGEG